MTSQEARLNRKLNTSNTSDSNATRQLFDGSAQRYAVFSQRLRQDTGSRSMLISGAYQPYTDSLRGTLAFLQQNPQLVGGSGAGAPGVSALPGVSTISGVSALPGVSAISAQAQAQLQKTVGQLQSLQAKMQDAANLQQYMQQRQAQIQQYLSKYTQLPSGVGGCE